MCWSTLTFSLSPVEDFVVTFSLARTALREQRLNILIPANIKIHLLRGC